MTEFEFTLEFAISEHHADQDKLVRQLYLNGCSDALIGLGRRGYIALDFVRDAQSLEEAVDSALRDVRQTIPNSILVRCEIL